ncbi:MAG TPA: DUF2752 domain-containing protein [Acidimicrobiales bacterium]
MAVATTTADRRGARALAGPAAAAAGALAGAGYLYARNPATQRGFIPCPFHSLTGLWCPGCGITRGLHKLVTGDIAGMLGMNVLLPFLLVAVVWGWGSWVQQSRGRPPLPSLKLPTWAWWCVGAAVVAYGVLRNLPVAPFSALAP